MHEIVADPVQPQQDGGEDVCGDVRPTGHAPQLSDVPPPAHSLHAGVWQHLGCSRLTRLPQIPHTLTVSLGPIQLQMYRCIC